MALPCQIAFLDEYYKNYREQFVFIALMCNHLPGQKATSALLYNYNVLNPVMIRYRGGGWPGYIQIFKKNSCLLLPYRETWNRSGFGKYYYADRCKLCNDALAEKADIVIGDAYFMQDDRKMQNGLSLCIIHNDKMCDIINEMMEYNCCIGEYIEDTKRIRRSLQAFQNRYAQIPKYLRIRLLCRKRNPNGSQNMIFNSKITNKDYIKWFEDRAIRL